jgi:PAS domain S-box-containing protein
VTLKTSQTRLHARLSRELQFFRALDATPDAVYLKDGGGRYLGMNAAGAALFGVTPEQIIGRTDADFFGPETARALRAVDDEVFASGRTVTLEETVPVLGQARIFQSTKAAYVDGDGVPVGVFGISRDITDARRANEERRDLRRALELTVEGVCRIDVGGRVVWANEAFASLCGTTPHDMVDEGWRTFIHPDDREMIASAFKGLVEGERFSLEIRPYCPDGTTTFARLTGVRSHTYDGAVNGAFCTLQDVSEQKQAEEAVKAAGEELARRNGELVSFASLAAHDLRQPLQIVGGFAALLADQCTGLDDRSKGYIAAICRGTGTMELMVGSLLEFVELGAAGAPTALVDTARVVADVVTGLEPTLDGGSIVVVGTLPVLPADAAQLARLFQNLLGNAVKFRGADLLRVEVAAERTGDDWLFLVSDNGTGVGRGFTDRIFGMMQRERRCAQPGTGMGLAICRKIVEYHGGRIWLDTEAEPPGATFRFTLPAGMVPAG